MNTLMWIGEYPERFGEQILRDRRVLLPGAPKRPSKRPPAAWLDGWVIWGDVAYRSNMFISPKYWRQYYKPAVARMIDLCHQHDLPVIYHGCGNVKAILPDFIEMGLEAYNPLESKAGLDVCDLRRQYGHTLGFCGNGDIPNWESGDLEAVRREVMRKLNAAKGGGYIFQSDHSVSSNVSGQTYDFIVKLVRQYGQYPLDLGEFDEAV